MAVEAVAKLEAEVAAEVVAAVAPKTRQGRQTANMNFVRHAVSYTLSRSTAARTGGHAQERHARFTLA